MAFVNERITDEDIKKYNLWNIWEKYKAAETITILDDDKPYDFAVDREREQWLIYLAMVKDESWEPKRQNYTGENIFIFYYNGQPYEVRLIQDSNEGHYVDKEKGIFQHEITWSLKSIYPEPDDTDTFKALLKEALEVYGERGLSSAKDINIIECNF